MLSQSQIAEVIDAQNEFFLQKNTGQKREMLDKISVQENFATIITGIRRCGKSTLMLQMLQNKLKNAIFLNFEDPRLAGFEKEDFTRLDKELKYRKAEVLFFDEIQALDKWENFVRKILDEDVKVVITGSNATLLSKELGTKLTGRHLSYELFPFSYAEFLSFKKLKSTKASAEKYLSSGGFPEFLKSGNGMILNHLLDDILTRDIAVRYGIRDIVSLRKLAVYLISNIGKAVSATNLKELFQIKSATTLLEYFSYLENTYIVQFVPKFSYSQKAQIRNPKKVYTIDLGLFSQNSVSFSEESGRRLENMVYLHLRRKHKEIYYLQEKKECDFVVFERGKPVELLQVCYELNADNLEREIQGLTEAMKFFEVKQGKIITMGSSDEFNVDGRKINVVPVWEYMGGE